MRRRRYFIPAICLAIVHAVVLLSGPVAPYDYSEQNRDTPYAPPTRLHWMDAGGRLHFRPFVYASVPSPAVSPGYVEDRSKPLPVRWLVHGSPYRLLGVVTCRTHLFGVDPPGRAYLLGTDAFGRDVFSRLLYGGRVSLFAGLFATLLSLAAGLVAGTLAGFYGRAVDEVVMRAAELFVALPWLYLLFALRAFLPLRMEPAQAFLVILAAIGLVGWARPARLVRGVVLSVKERTFVLAARMFGASDLYLMRRHILPETASILLTQAGILVPQYILAEVALSFLGLGVGEPVPSWGNMLGTLQEYHVMVSYWWMWTPCFALVAVLLWYRSLADARPDTKRPATA